MKKILLTSFIFYSFFLFSQTTVNEIDYTSPKKYTLAGITVTGNEEINRNVIISYAGLITGKEIYVPGEEIMKAISNLWKQKLFSDIKILVDKVEGDKIYLLIEVKTRARLSRYTPIGISKSKAEKIREKISLKNGDILTDQLLQNTANQIRKYYIEKGYYNPTIRLEQVEDTAFGKVSVKLNIYLSKGKRTKIDDIIITGNQQVKASKIQRLLKKTKQHVFWNIFRSSKFDDELYTEDKQRIVDYYNSLGFRDAKLEYDSTYLNEKGWMVIKLKIHEGKKYYFRNILWTGNTKYTSEKLSNILGIQKGDVYNMALLNQKLEMAPNGLDVKSLYMDNGYLFFRVIPVETMIIGDSIDLELRMVEGPPAIINNIIITGNLKTSDHVILREIRTRPGQKFSRADVLRSQSDLANLGYFDPEQMQILPYPNYENGTVDIEYKLVERPSDQLQLQGGWGAGQFVGSVGIVFTNFSTKKILKLKEWKPLPSGDGQSISLRFQSNALYFTSYNFSFTEPWLGGKKPNQLTVSVYHSIQSNGLSKGDDSRQEIKITGGAVGIGKRLQWPDDYFTLYNEISYQVYNLNNYSYEFSFTDGQSNNLNLKHVLSRNSLDQPVYMYPRSGGQLSLSLQWTPPFSLFNNIDYSTASDQEKYKWIEYHKWKLDASWYLTVIGKLVLNTKLQFGLLGDYNKNIGVTPFERFYVGGDGLGNYNLLGREYIALRGYENNSLTAKSNTQNGGTIFNKYTFELRYPISLNPQALVYATVFAEAGNSWLKFKDFDPFRVYRSLGAGVRIFMPYFGLLGFDWGYGFDDVPGSPDVNKGNFHISINQQF